MSLLSQIGSAVTEQWGKNSDLFRQLSAALDVLSRMRLTHSCQNSNNSGDSMMVSQQSIRSLRADRRVQTVVQDAVSNGIGQAAV